MGEEPGLPGVHTEERIESVEDLGLEIQHQREHQNRMGEACPSINEGLGGGAGSGILTCYGLCVWQRPTGVEALVRGLGRIVSEARGHAGGALNISAEDLDGEWLIGKEI